MATGRIGRPVSRVVKRSSCRSIMLRQEELAFIKAIFSLQLSPALVREPRMGLFRRKKRSVVLAWSRGTTSGGGAEASQQQSRQLACKRKANELASLGDSSEAANRCPTPCARSAPLAATSSVTGE